MIKLYILETPDDLKSYEQNPTQQGGEEREQEVVSDSPAAEEPATRRHYSARSP